MLLLLYTVLAQSLSEQYVKLLEPGWTTYHTRFTKLVFRTFDYCIFLSLVTLHCAVVLCFYYHLYFLIALFSYSAFKAGVRGVSVVSNAATMVR